MQAGALVHGPSEISQSPPFLTEVALDQREAERGRERQVLASAHRMPGMAVAEGQGSLGMWHGHSTHLHQCSAAPLIPKDPEEPVL